jgi:hypothetical protein
MIGAPLDEAIREQIQRLLTERQVNVRLTALLEALHQRRHIELPL